MRRQKDLRVKLLEFELLMKCQSLRTNMNPALPPSVQLFAAGLCSLCQGARVLICWSVKACPSWRHNQTQSLSAANKNYWTDH